MFGKQVFGSIFSRGIFNSLLFIAMTTAVVGMDVGMTVMKGMNEEGTIGVDSLFNNLKRGLMMIFQKSLSNPFFILKFSIIGRIYKAKP
jgi:hypothetical protein